ncbi:hypothetical protein ARMSODRAFT_801737 [Armillaria solidipes]|uniref:Uncharacterized protein n=1 Tax=Armillaria solidipes TaxID=1076256 RepID=A0A2H3AKE7_9AGAR|nr:hypothetical protein ARMSODRAFT_801737 [Armillaria solidipes]
MLQGIQLGATSMSMLRVRRGYYIAWHDACNREELFESDARILSSRQVAALLHQCTYATARAILCGAVVTAAGSKHRLHKRTVIHARPHDSHLGVTAACCWYRTVCWGVSFGCCFLFIPVIDIGYIRA